MRKVILSLQLLLCSLIGVAQSGIADIKNSISKTWSFHSVNQVGMLEGERGTSLLLQTINGISYKGWFAGIGVGLDYYAFRTIPLFADVRKNLFNSKRSPFLYADAGRNFTWVKRTVENAWYKSDFNNGWYYDAGIGYALETKKSGALILSIGYSEKKLSEIRSNPVMYFDILPPATDNLTRFDYQLKRLSIKAGWKF